MRKRLPEEQEDEQLKQARLAKEQREIEEKKIVSLPKLEFVKVEEIQVEIPAPKEDEFDEDDSEYTLKSDDDSAEEEIIEDKIIKKPRKKKKKKMGRPRRED